VGGGLIHDFPDAVDPKQRMEVDPRARQIRDIVKSEEDTGNVARLSHRDNSADNVDFGSDPLFETVDEECFVKGALIVGEENPGVLVEGLPKLVNVALVEAVDVELDDSDDLVGIGRCGSHGFR
jgi:hypothetical protein